MTELESCHTATQLPTAAAGRVSHSGDLSRTLSELLIEYMYIDTTVYMLCYIINSL